MTATASPSVLLLAWDHTSDALSVAQALPQATAELWLPEPLDAAPVGTRVQLLAGELPESPEFAGLGSAAPAYPYVGNSSDAAATATTTANSASSPAAAQMAVAAAPDVGNGPPTASAQPAQTEPTARPLAEPSAVEPSVAGPGVAEPSVAEASAAATEPSRDLTALDPPVPRFDEAYFVTVEEIEEEIPSASPTATTVAQPQPLADAELVSTEPAPIEPIVAPAPAAVVQPIVPPPVVVPEAQELLQAADTDDLNFRIIRYARHAVRLARETKFEVVFAPDWPTWLAGVEISQLTRRPLVLRVKQLAADRSVASERGWREALERLTLPHADRVLVPDQATAERLQALYGIRKERVHVLPNDVEPNLTAALVLETRLSA